VAHEEDRHFHGRRRLGWSHEIGDSRRNLEYKMQCNFPWGIPL
jgi:hypothetical protein